ncbi:MAG TPA: glycosyltransferase family 2 protein [Polyangiaceae bacterium]|nr:glycosyltransferase family 2 protein [Polyangiaceae bacterium]
MSRLKPSIDVIVPVYNEVACVAELYARLRQSCPNAQLIFVDNASTDGTCELLASLDDVTLVRHSENLGYGRSLRDGVRAGNGDRVVMIDADLEYHPEDIPALIAALAHADAVYGSRFSEAGVKPTQMALSRRAGNALVSSAFGVLFGQPLTDLYTGLRAVRRDALHAVPLHCDGFEFVLELAARLAQAECTLAEVPVHYTAREHGVSKMRHARELFKFARYLLQLKLARGTYDHVPASSSLSP